MSNQSRFHIHPRAFQFIRQLWQWCFFVVLLTAGYHGQGQTYPVQVTTTLLPPYSPELSYYSSADVNNMQVFVHVLELDRVDYRAKLRLTIEGAGVRLTTLPSYVPNPLVLQGGVPLMLSGFDLRHYLNPDHLAFEGMTKADFMRNGRLPEGFYTFTIEVLDYTRGVRVSNASMATAWIVLNDPPLINFPINADKITLSEPQFVNFSWLGRHLASPNAAFSTEYEFSLYEMLPGQTSPDAAVRSSNTIYRTTTTQSSLLYGPAEPLLEPGKKYAFRVQAYDVSGRDLFKNQGYSETYWFQYGDECMPVKFLAGEALDDSRIKVTWESEMSHTGFTLQYREKGKSSWHTEQALFGAQVIPDLQANTEYEYQVAGKCLNYIGDYSTIQTVKTEERTSGPEDEGTYACGEEGEASDLNPTPLEKTLRTLDQFEIGGIDVIILEATKGSDGSYTGTGYSPLPIFKGAGLKVSIENVIINEDYKAIAGKVVTTYDEEGSFIFGSHDEREPEGEDVPNGIEDLPTVVVTIPVEIASVTVADGVVTVLDETGTPVSLESTALPAEGNTLTLEDASGDQWLVDSEGNVQKAEPTAASQAAGTAPAAISADEDVDFSITFEAYTDQKFGFDDPKQPFDKTTTGLSVGYTQKQVQEENYWVAWKSVATGQTDWVTAIHDAGEALPAYVGFKTTTGELASQPSEQEQSKAITVLGKSNQHTETVTAYVKQEDEEGNETEKTLGVLQVISYDQVRERVIIVPVNDATVPDAYTVGEALNRIYGQAVAHWEVEVSSSYQVEAEILTQLDEGESGILSSFPSNMQGFNRDYKRSLDNYDKDAYYLFLIPGSDSDRAGLSADRAGFMPFKRQFGYIWTDKASNQSTTIAHELGHGAFRLRHTFSTENFVAAQGSTDNLMDYNNGTQLYKHQWDFVHDPESMVGWFQEDEEGAMMAMSFFEIEFVEEVGEEHTTENCYQTALDRGYEVYEKFEKLDLGIAAGMLAYHICETSIENCGTGSGVEAFSCGLANALLQELDMIAILELIESASLDIDKDEIITCVVEEISMVSRPDETMETILFKCITGIDALALGDQVKEFVEDNWDEPYYQGQATGFILTLITPLKGKIITKLKTLPKYTSKISKLEKLSAAKNLDELKTLAKATRSILFKNIDEAVLAHIEDITSKLYRGDTRGVDDIFQNGFTSRGTNTDLLDYVETNAESIYVGTTKQPSVATSKFLKDKKGYVYIIDKKGTMTDVNNFYSAMGDVNIYADELEVVIENAIPSSQIKGAFEIDINGNIIGDLIVNPTYVP
ncbi:hypothetical protein [Reichenbachiella sp. MSK19-1]|uniref:scabin-related ADP-ribosyltransferase n=1 Tax=Reichenbachiella sp. MSK19-1 TaxID=1897631 RepID=UPI000E6CC097|nr:hypothetical protein [Reichenbachiella sp. MSK19-1]RJE71210.1 hypothetical protein BGP76_08645 [Reichenbachiella sp. MSK19-1]